MAVKGVDISVHNGSVDFAALKTAGIGFVIIRCGYGSDYALQDDKCFAENVRKAEAAGMPWGVYLYSYAANSGMAESEARHVLRLLAGRKPAYGVWYDVEDEQQSGVDLVEICDTFCTAIEAAGLYAGIYSTLSWWNGKLDHSRLDKYDKWVAQWNSSCDYRKPYGIWQYTDNLSIGGKRFDGNWAYKDYPALTKSTTAGKKEEPELTKAEIEVAARAAAKAEVERLNPTYDILKEVPDYWREDIKELVEKGIIGGIGAGKLGLTKSDCKAAVIAKRIREKL